jgi:hypothetical protein
MYRAEAERKRGWYVGGNIGAGRTDQDNVSCVLEESRATSRLRKRRARSTWRNHGDLGINAEDSGHFCTSGNSPMVARDCVVELVGLELTTKVLWNMGVFDQPTSSDTRARAQKVRY